MRIYKDVVLLGFDVVVSAEVSGEFGDFDVEELEVEMYRHEISELLECCYDSSGVPVMRLAEIAFREAVEERDFQ